MKHLPTLKQLRYLVALQDEGHFGRAAENSFVTQATLSSAIAQLEALLGATLVERARRVTRFTPVGERIAAQARRVLREAEQIVDIAGAANRPLTDEVRLGVIPTIAPFFLPALLPKLRSEWPDLKLYLREETSQAACDLLRRGQLDCLLLALPFECGAVDSEALFDDRLYVAFPPGSEPGTAGVTPAAIDEERLLLLEDGHCLKDHALAACGRPGLRSDAAMLGTSLHTLVQMVANGLGTTLVPEMAIEAGILEGTGIEARRLDAPGAARRIALVWRKGSPREEEFRLLASALAEGAAASAPTDRARRRD